VPNSITPLGGRDGMAATNKSAAKKAPAKRAPAKTTKAAA
jgi:hypothetical protein